MPASFSLPLVQREIQHAQRDIEDYRLRAVISTAQITQAVALTRNEIARSRELLAQLDKKFPEEEPA